MDCLLNLAPFAETEPGKALEEWGAVGQSCSRVELSRSTHVAVQTWCSPLETLGPVRNQSYRTGMQSFWCKTGIVTYLPRLNERHNSRWWRRVPPLSTNTGGQQTAATGLR